MRTWPAIVVSGFLAGRSAEREGGSRTGTMPIRVEGGIPTLERAIGDPETSYR